MLQESENPSELTWKDVLGEEKEKEYFKKILDRVYEEETRGIIVYPPAKDRFNAFRFTPFEKVKVVILGQDPYVNPGQAHGLCFSVPQGAQLPPSLVNIYKEIESDLGVRMDYSNGCLISWATQGVLLLNAILTVRKGQPLSHKDLGWETFTDFVLSKISSIKKGCVFLLWGAFAWKKERLINKFKHLVLKASHPSPLSANKGFFGCRHFSKTNDFLVANSLTPIRWQNTD
ncbi:MAG: uracil-DNA glycosylase [Deltaproteobacteria bacterium]|nr:uracil-DNA glycosylase [Deltaproteobacteria bacterium]MCX7953182.1 uracil-DNA glycosylase [Deltaproteobacteria bacterium]